MTVFENPNVSEHHNRSFIEYNDKIELVIDNIPCELEFGIRKGYWWIHICDRDIYNTSDFSTKNIYYSLSQLSDKNTFKEFDEKAEITPEIIQSFVNVILNTLETLKFSKVEGCFMLKSVCRKIICQKMVFGKFMENENKDDSKCSVCFDYTKTKTPCNHVLCIPCWIQIKNKTCPMCRDNISYFERNEDDEN